MSDTWKMERLPARGFGALNFDIVVPCGAAKEIRLRKLRWSGNRFRLYCN